ncbi:phosphoribosyltransferase family protein [Paenibacillus xylanexedens]|uniref:phosphoribosyltransferase family protein n=1 Tax=Paenibacillus xylanexedens TaxID=528191 RepID=UPI0034D98662
MIKDVDVWVEGGEVVIVEEIIDSGVRVSYVIDVVEKGGWKCVGVVRVFDKG